MEIPSTRNFFRRFGRTTLYRSYLFTLIGLTAAAGGYFSLPYFQSNAQETERSFTELHSLPVTVPTERYGFALDTFHVFENNIQSGTFLGDILLRFNLDYASIEKLVRTAKGTFDVRRFQPGKPYTVLAKDTSQRADYFIYEPNAYEYVVFHLQEPLKVEKIKREVESEVRTATGTISSSLWNAMTDQGLSPMLADKMEDALQWSLDFHKDLQKGDQFQLIYEQNFIEGQPVGIGRLLAAKYTSGATTHHAIFYETETESGYYDLKGRPMKSWFLKAPVRASRISSYYNLNRLHPILKYRRPHFGTDYAAPYGTEIMAVGNGTVTHAGYTKGNGNYVKIRHDDTYQTQYLHMQRFAKGIKPGTRVKQGQVIGYVGSTGLATGPHVCFRFWKNGKQVNHLKLSFPPAHPLPDDIMPAFNELKDQYMAMFAEMTEESVIAANTVVENNTEEKDPISGNP